MTELTRIVALDRIGGAGLETVVEASAEECEALARRMRVPAVNQLRCAFRLRRIADREIEAQGELDAEVVQECVVSLAPFVQPVAEAFSVQFVPAGTEAPDDDLEAPDQIPYDGGAIDVGEAAAQQLALALEPFPRAPGVDTPGPGEPDDDDDAEPKPHPFAILAALRQKQ